MPVVMVERLSENRPGEFECDLVLRDEDGEQRIPHTFLVAIRPGTYVRMDGRDWIVAEVEERMGLRPEVVCRPAAEPS